jgi:nucleoid-associated protein YgaU
MPPAPVAKSTTDPYAGYGGGATRETSTNTWSSNAGTEASSNSGQTADLFHSRTAQGTADSHVSQRQIEGYSPQPQAESRTQSDWQSGSQSGSQAGSQFPAPDSAVVSPGTDAAALTGSGQSATLQEQAYPQGNSSGYATGGSSLRVQPTSQYPTDNHEYVSSDTHGYTGGTSPAESPSPLSSQNSYDASSQGSYSASPQDYKTSSQSSYSGASPDYQTRSQASVPAVSGSLSMDSGSAGSSQYGFSNAQATPGKYTIQPNDNYSIISKKLYGTDSYFRALEQHNRAIFPDANRLGVNKEIATPDESELMRLYPELCPTPEHREAAKQRRLTAGTVSPSGGASVYVVQEGDTLFDIARYELGKASRWAEIYKLNRDRLGKSFDYLTPGLELAMPADVTRPDQPVGVVTRRSDDRR